MSTPVESANLILRLYELRREEMMRKARDFMVTFDPQSYEELMAGFMGPNGAYIRMVTSYWDMAASFVVNGAIDAKMFDECNGEHIIVFGRMEPFLPTMRETMQNPNIMANLEKVCLSAPNGRERVDKMRDRLREMLKQRAAAAQTAS